ncbi:MAG: SAM hydrolase/SAM-dependent halogenase family protein [Gammaproteobacteria bacterium]
MVILFTDFGATGPYVGQVKAVLAREAPQVPIIDLLHEAPAMNPRAAAYLLAALAPSIKGDAAFVCVVDPGVGTTRRALALHADGRWFVGPDNGLLDVVALRAKSTEWWEIQWRPEQLSATFHGRDLFAPVAAKLARGEPPPGARCDSPAKARNWPADLPEVVYLDPYGNAATGLRAKIVGSDVVLRANERCFCPVTTFGDAPAGTAIWYENSNAHAELAISEGSAAGSCGLAIGTAVTVLEECP